MKEHKGAHHAPKSVDFADAIPLVALGKPDKKALRAQYWARQRPPGRLTQPASQMVRQVAGVVEGVAPLRPVPAAVVAAENVSA